ncbi:hypothetical protein AX15_002203 [Amanita polypyramis BW_CC]|nr:hypothetical protein AX15_002203 [Amanita polypyramis BW_CC]
MPAPGHNYTFNLNLSQVGVLLNAVLFSYPQQQYNPLYKNCFSHSHILWAVIICIIQEQQPAGHNNIVTTHEPDEFGVKLGTCFGFHLDRRRQSGFHELSRTIYTVPILSSCWNI